MSVESKIREWVLENYLFTEDPKALKNDDSFLDKGIIDSTGILEVIAYIEECFEVEVEDDEMVPENLDSVDNIVAYVARKQA